MRSIQVTHPFRAAEPTVCILELVTKQVMLLYAEHQGMQKSWSQQGIRAQKQKLTLLGLFSYGF